MLQNISIFEFIYNFVSVIAIIDFIYKAIFRLINKDVINFLDLLGANDIITYQIRREIEKIIIIIYIGYWLYKIIF